MIWKNILDIISSIDITIYKKPDIKSYRNLSHYQDVNFLKKKQFFSQK